MDLRTRFTKSYQKLVLKWGTIISLYKIQKKKIKIIFISLLWILYF